MLFENKDLISLKVKKIVFENNTLNEVVLNAK